MPARGRTLVYVKGKTRTTAVSAGLGWLYLSIGIPAKPRRMSVYVCCCGWVAAAPDYRDGEHQYRSQRAHEGRCKERRSRLALLLGEALKGGA